MYQENIQKIFLEEIREKKKTGSGSFHKRGKGVKHGISGALRTPFYYMKTKERKKLNGEVTVTNLFTTIIPYQEFQLKDVETQKSLLTKWREVFNNEKIANEMEINKSVFYDLVNTLELPKKSRGGRIVSTKKKEKKKEKEILISSDLEFESPVIVETKPQPQVQKIITKGLYLEYNGDYNAEELSKLFTKLQLLIDGESNKYNISLSLTEKQD